MKYQKKVLLMGGMGNKFFQISRALEFKRNNLTVEIVFIDHSIQRLYKLSGHTIHSDWLDIVVLARNLGLDARPINFIEFISLGLRFICRKLGLPTRFDEKIEDVLILDSNFIKSKWDIGYFQSRHHVSKRSLDKVADGLLSLLDIQKTNISDVMTCHIRGGDFASNMRLSNNEIQALVNFCKSESLKLVVVTNDKIFCRVLFEDQSYDLAYGKSALDDFAILASSRNLYLSNSTFAFWAALIAIRSHNTMTYVPENWSYTDFISGTEKAILKNN